MSVLHAEEVEILLPKRPLLVERRIAETGLHPGRNASGIDARLLHVVLVFVARDRAFPERVIIDRLEQRLLLSRFYTDFDEVTHGKIKRNASPARCHSLAFMLMILIVLL